MRDNLKEENLASYLSIHNSCAMKAFSENSFVGKWFNFLGLSQQKLPQTGWLKQKKKCIPSQF